MNIKEYKYFNFSMFLTLLAVFIFPIIIMYLNINIKICQQYTHCNSCGITRDFYNIIRFNSSCSQINRNSIIIFQVFTSNLLFRLIVLLCFSTIVNMKYIKKIDFILTIISLILLYILFNN